MKKIISIIAALSLVTTVFASFAHAAADVTFKLAGVKTSYAVDATALVRMTITAPNGFAGFKTTLSYDTSAFDYVSSSKSADLDGSIAEDASAGKVVHAFGTAEDLMPTKTVFDEELGEDVETACKYTITYRFTVKSDAYNGDYNFGIDVSDIDLVNAAGTILTSDVSGATATIKVTGGKDVVTVDYAALDAAIADFGTKTETDYTAESWAAAKTAYDAAVAAKTATTQAEVDAATTALTNAIAALKTKPVDKVEVKPETTVIKKDNPSGLWTFGFGGTVEITGSKTFSKLIFTLEDTVNSKTGSYTWDFKTPINANVTYGLNIKGCPVDSNVTATVEAQ